MRDYSVKENQQSKKIRKDAYSNRKDIIQATRKLLEQQGSQISLTEIAKAAGVSRPTLYRNFPDMNSIVNELFHDNLDNLAAYSLKISAHQDRFFLLMEAFIEQQANYQALASKDSMDELIMKRVILLFDEPIEEARKNKRIRPDFDKEQDLMILLMMLGGTMINYNGNKPERIRRALQLVSGGLAI